MKSVVLSVLASGAAAAQAAQITSGPLAGLGLGSHLFQNAAINPSDPEYTTCAQAVSIVQECVSQAGGLDAAATADPEALVACACCNGRRNAAPLYSACSDYLEEEAPENTSQYQAYGTLYSACNLGAKCTGGSNSGGSGGSSVTGGSGSGGSGDSITSGGSRPTATTADDDDDNDTATITTSPAEQTYASACVDMLSIFNSCSRKDREFTGLPFKEQAECYCCRGSGTRLTWTDEMDNYASTCADWARTGEPDTAYNVAKTFATFCEHFTDVCSTAATRTSESEATATEDSGSRQTGASSGDDGDDSNSDATTSENNQGPVTVTVQPTSTDSSDSGNDASSARVGFGAVLAAVAALAIAL